MPLQLSWTNSNYGIKKRMHGRMETRLQLPMIMLVDDGLWAFAAIVEFREDIAFLDLVEGHVEARSCEVCGSNLDDVSDEGVLKEGGSVPSMLRSPRGLPQRQVGGRRHPSLLPNLGPSSSRRRGRFRLRESKRASSDLVLGRWTR